MSSDAAAAADTKRPPPPAAKDHVAHFQNGNTYGYAALCSHILDEDARRVIPSITDLRVLCAVTHDCEGTRALLQTPRASGYSAATMSHMLSGLAEDTARTTTETERLVRETYREEMKVQQTKQEAAAAAAAASAKAPPALTVVVVDDKTEPVITPVAVDVKTLS